MPFTDPDQARAYLSSLSDHRNRPGDTANMHPDFAIKLANALEQARGQGLNLGVMSGYRDPAETTNQGLRTRASLYDLRGESSHSYGLASDVKGLDGPNGPITQKWAQIAGANGLSNPYGIGNGKEFNHWQIGPKLETNPTLLASLKAARATGNFQNVWNAYSSGSGGAVTPSGPDNRQLIFNTLVNQVGLTPQQALGALYSLGGESGSRLSSTAVGAGGDFGIAQWTGTRKTALDAYAASYGKPPTDPQIQAQFMAGELLGNDPKIPAQAGVLAALKATQSPEDAARIWTAKMEVPKVDNSGERIARGSHVGSLDAQGNLVLGDGAGGSTTPGTAAYTNTQTPGQPAAGGAYPYVPATPEQRFDMSMGEILGSLGSGGGGGYASGGIPEPPDQPAIRMPALDAQFTQTPNPVPQAFAAGVQPGAGLGSQLASTVGALPDPDASLTQGAPSMTSMLGNVGTPDTYNLMDPRRTVTPSLTMRGARLA